MPGIFSRLAESSFILQMRSTAWLRIFVLAALLSTSIGFLSRSGERSRIKYGRPTSETRIYGIKGFRAWFEGQFPDSTVSINADFSSDTFDHVLLDMNQILHVIQRRSRNDDHAVRLLMSELDRILKVTVPTQSLVLAIDGAPAAAKLATQRRRRYGTYIRTEWKLQHFEKLRISKRQRAKKLRNYNSELESLQITPATKFQKRMESALLYWAWQRLQPRNGKFGGVQIYVSPSSVPGEGEVKLLEWVLQKPRKGQSIAILGGDSDLILEGLIIPPHWTHNVFVIQQESSNNYSSVSLWETTLKLQSWLPPNAPPQQILQVRTDLVLLMILNGNDYLPKLRGSRGFSNICHIYQRLLREHAAKNVEDTPEEIAGLVHPDTLEFRLDFCLDFFQEVAKSAPAAWVEDPNTDARKERKTPLSELNSIIDAGFLPNPKRFRVIRRGPQSEGIEEGNDDVAQDLVEDDDEDEEEERSEEEDSLGESNDGVSDDEEEDDDEHGTGKILVQLCLGQRDKEGFLQYEVWHDQNESFKTAKQDLAAMALDDFLGTDYTSKSDYELEEGITNSGYSWEVSNSVEGKVDRYLNGLLWNLQTYQDGVCADYYYNYGRRVSPSANQIVAFFKQAKEEKRTVNRRDLSNDKFGPPVSAGLSCLAALPSQVKHLVPEPYNWLSDETVEEFYEQSMDPFDNFFDMRLFEELCETEIAKLKSTREVAEIPHVENDKFRGRRIVTGDRWWTVLGRSSEPVHSPFNPPPPPSETFTELWANPRIRVSRSFALEAPRPRSAWDDKRSFQRKHDQPLDIHHSDFGDFVLGKDHLQGVPYKIAFKAERKKSATKDLKKIPTKQPSPQSETPDVRGRLKTYGKNMPSSELAANVDGETALSILTQLHDLNMIGPVQYSVTFPSQSEYAAWDPKKYENFQLNILRSKTKQCVLERTWEFDQDRDVFNQSKQALKQHLADLALSQIVGPKYSWTQMAFADVRFTLQEKAKTRANEKAETEGTTPIMEQQSQNDLNKNKAGETALACLKQLEDTGIVGAITFETSKSKAAGSAKAKPGKFERVQLLMKPDKSGTLLPKPFKSSRTRDINNDGKQAVKQELASRALSRLTGPDFLWSEASFAELKQFLLSKIECE